MKIIDVDQKTEEWHDFRLLGIGASESAKVLGLSKYGTALDVYNDKLGLAPPTYINEHMKRGIELEDSIRESAETMLDKVFYPVCAIHDEHDFLRASFDGITSDKKIVLECKAPAKPPAKEAIDNPREHMPDYWVQVQHQICVADAEEGYLVIYSQGEFNLLHIPRDDDFIHGTLIPSLMKFWIENVVKRTPPTPKKADETLVEAPEAEEELKAIEELLLQKEELKQQLKELEVKEKDLTDKLAEYGDDGNLIFSNGLRLKRSSRTTVAYKQACEDHELDLQKYTKFNIGGYKASLPKGKK